MKKILTVLIITLISMSLFGCQKAPAKDEILEEPTVIEEPIIEEEPTLSLEEKVIGKWRYARRYASADDMLLMYLFTAGLNWEDLSEEEQAKISEEAAMYAYDEEVPEEEVYYVEFKDGLYYDPSVPEGAIYEIDEEKGTMSLAFVDGESMVTFIGFEDDMLRIDMMAHHNLFEKVTE